MVLTISVPLWERNRAGISHSVAIVPFRSDRRAHFKVPAANYVRQNIRHLRGSTLAGNTVSDGVFAGSFLVE